MTFKRHALSLSFMMILFVFGCQSSDRQQSYSIEYPHGWKIEKIVSNGTSAEQASCVDGTTIVVAENTNAYSYSKHYNIKSNEFAEFLATNLFGPVARNICPIARLGDHPNVASLNNGRSVQAIYVCGDDIIWFTTVFGDSKAYMIVVTANKHDHAAASTVQKCIESFRILN